MATRESKFISHPHKGHLVLQPRDLQLLEAVSQYRYLQRDQMQRLLDWNCLTRVNSRLRKLFDAGFLTRTFLPTVKGSSQAVYSIGKNAVDIVSKRLGNPVEEVKKQVQASRKASPLFFSHSLLVSEARMRLATAFKQDRIEVNTWLNDLECTDHFSFRDGRGRIVKRHFKPDGYCRFIHGGKVYSLFLEMDTGTMRYNRIALKAKIYQEYRDLGLYTERSGLKNFRVLFVCTSSARAKAIQSALESDNRNNVWFVTLENITPDSVCRSIWLKTFETESIPFLPVYAQGVAN